MVILSKLSKISLWAERKNWTVLLTFLLVTPAHAGNQMQSTQATGLWTEASTRIFDIAPQPLSSALQEFGRQAHKQVSYKPELTEGVLSPGVRGSHVLTKAMSRILQGSGLNYKMSGNTFTLEKKNSWGKKTLSLKPVEDQEKTPELFAQAGKENSKKQKKKKQKKMQLKPLNIIGERVKILRGETTYIVTESNTATRTDTPVLETPASILSVTRKAMDDQNLLELRDAYRNVSGAFIDFTGANVFGTEVGILRGFPVNEIYRNGIPSGGIAPAELTNIQRIDILKGPASMLFGRSQPGGLINLVTKTPQQKKFFRLEQTLGQYSLSRTTFDGNMPLNDSGTVLARLNFSQHNDNTFRDFANVERTFFAPALTWKPTDKTTLFFEGSYSDEDYPFDHGVPLGPNGFQIADISTNLGEPNFRSERREVWASARLQHKFSSETALRSYVQFHYMRNDLNAFRYFGTTRADNTIDRNRFDNSIVEDGFWQGGLDVLHKFKLGPTKHQVVAGSDFRWTPDSMLSNDGGRDTRTFNISVTQPVYGTVPNPNSVIDLDHEIRWMGFYIQDQIDLFDDRLHILLGGRYDYVDQDASFDSFNSTTGAVNFIIPGERDSDAFTGRAGALFELTDWLSPFVNVSQSFFPAFPLTASSQPLDPEEGLQYEGGIKMNFFEERLTANLAIYQITKENIPIADPNNPNFSLNGGKVRSRGFEFDLNGEVLPGLNVIANYAYTDTKVIISPSLPVGAPLRNVPLHAGRLWLGYDFQGGSLKGLGFGAGVTVAGDRKGSNDTSLELDGYAVGDLAVWYRKPIGPFGIKTQLNVRNFTDAIYSETANGTASHFPGDPLTVIGSVGIEF